MNTQGLTPETMEQLHEALEHMTCDSKIIGGGTDLVIRLENRLLKPDLLVCHRLVPQTRGISRAGGELEIGACATMREIAGNALISEMIPGLKHAAEDVGSAQIRNRGTIGGNVANASPAGDLAPVLYLYGASAEIAGPGGTLRREPVGRIIAGPGKTTLAFNEVLTRFFVPIPPAGQYSAFCKLGFRKALTISRIGIAAALTFDASGLIVEANLIAGAISTAPVRVPAAESLLRGNRLDAAAKRAAGQALSDLIMEITPEHFDRNYKAGAAFGVMEDVLDRLNPIG